MSVSYSPDGELITSGSLDGRVGLWDGRTSAVLGTVRVAEPRSATYVGFDPDGDVVHIVTWEGKIHRMSTSAEQWITHACALAGRNLRTGVEDRIRRPPPPKDL